MSVDKKAIDDSLSGSIAISAEPSARVESAAFWEMLSRLLDRMATQPMVLALTPLRLILLTRDLGTAVKSWQFQLGVAEAGVSDQPEGVAVAKTLFWGKDVNSARAILIVNDAIAFAAMQENSVAVSTIIHELGHVHDYFLRGLAHGFLRSQVTPSIADWPTISASFAKILWSEYAAESIATIYMSDDDLRVFMDNDRAYLSGIQKRIRERVADFHLGQIDLGSLWSYCIMQLSNVFSNLGRAAARLSFAESPEEALGRLAGINDVAAWQPIIEQFVRELGILDSKNYCDWPVAPFLGIEEGILLSFHVVGLFPTYESGNLRVRVC